MEWGKIPINPVTNRKQIGFKIVYTFTNKKKDLFQDRKSVSEIRFRNRMESGSYLCLVHTDRLDNGIVSRHGLGKTLLLCLVRVLKHATYEVRVSDSSGFVEVAGEAIQAKPRSGVS